MVLWLLSSMLQRGATWTGGIGGRTLVMFRLQNWPVRKPMSLVNPIKEVVNSKVYLCSSCPHWLWICYFVGKHRWLIVQFPRLIGAQDLLPKRFPELNHSGKIYRWSGETSKSNAMSILTAQKHLFGNSSWLRHQQTITRLDQNSHVFIPGPRWTSLSGCWNMTVCRNNPSHKDLLQTIQSWLSVLLCSCGIIA